MDCDAVLSFVLADIENSVGNASADCEVDADCVMAEVESDCVGLCPIASHTIWATKLASKIKLVSDDYCDGYQDQCPYVTPDCFPAEAACIGGVCQAVPTD